jgi:hypothetical protein
MNGLILGGIVLAAVVLLLLRKLFGRGGKPARAGYQKRDFLFSPEERLFHAALKQAVGENYEIFGKIRIRDVVSLRPPLSRKDSREEFEILGEGHFTFVLCNKSDLSVACAVQLRGHAFAGKKASGHPDPLKSICHAVGLPLVLFEAGPWYDANEVKDAIAQAVRKEPLYLTESDGRKEPRISRLDNLEI